MWRAVFEDGTSADSSQMYWTDIPKDKKIEKLTLSPLEKEFVGKVLSGLDSYYYVIEAIAVVSSGKTVGNLEAEIIGGVNLELKTFSELRFNHRTGVLEETTKPMSEFKYSKDILIPGKK